MPAFLEKFLSAAYMPLLARILFTFLFWMSGLHHLLVWEGNVQGLTYLGFSSPNFLNGVIAAVNLIGAGLIIQGRFAWIGVGILAGFTLATIFVVHNFWTMEPPQSIGSMHTAWEHITVIGALFLYLVYERRAGLNS